MGAALAYYALLSLMPLALVVISIAGLVFGTSTAEARVMHQVQLLIGEQRASILEALLQGAQNKADGFLATVAGLLILTFGATGVLIELRKALNTVWEVPVSSVSTLQEFIGIVKERLWSLVLVFGIVVILTASLLFGTSISALSSLTSFPKRRCTSLMPWFLS
jgi:membrane protein